MAEDERIEREDSKWIEQMAQRDARALSAFYDRYNRIAFSLILRIVRVREDAEDVLVDVFWQVWQQSGRYNPSRGRPLAWLLNISRTRAIDHLRSRQRRLEVSDDAEAAGSAATAQQTALESDPFIVAGTRRAVAKCLETLTPEQRAVLELAYFEGMSHSEIAASLNQPLGTMKDRIRTGMMRLRKCLKPFEVSA
jgi:RNA polymerase sigma-70 factor (ECF subfamily)